MQPYQSLKRPSPPNPKQSSRHTQAIPFALSLRAAMRNVTAVAGGACLMQALTSQPLSAAITVPGGVSTSWFGNSWAMNAAGEPKHANNAVEDIWVAPDGTTINTSQWDEAAQEMGIYKDGDKIGSLNNTHSAVDGRAITGNANYVFASQINTFKRWSRSTGSPDGSAVDTSGQVWGLGADATRLFVGTDANGGRIRVYNPTTLAFVSEWTFARPGRMSVDTAGNLWAIQRGDASNAPQAVKFSPTGTQLANITFATGVDPTDIATDAVTRVLVSDGGLDQNVKIYNAASLSGAPTTVSDSLGTVGGIFAAGGGYVRGQAGPGRFDEPLGVGVDSSGNYYVATWGPVSLDGAVTHNGSTIESYNASKARLWRVFGLEFEDCGDIDPTDANVIYTKDGKYSVNWGNGVGQEATYWGTSLDHVAYPADPRIWINKNGNNNGGSRIVSAGGQKFMYVWDQQSQYMQVYRFVGDIAVPAVLIKKDGGAANPLLSSPASADPWVGWMWQDADQDGQFDANEYSTTHDNPYMFGWNVDSGGNIWKGMRNNGIRKFTLTVSANGMPTYSTANSTLVTNPAPFNVSMGDIRRVHYEIATDTMYVLGFNDLPSEGGGAGNLLARYPNWNTGNRTASGTTSLPYLNVPSDISQNANSNAMDVVGEYVFVAYFDPGAARIRVYKSSDLSFVGEITADRVIGSIHGTDVDTPNGVNAFLRANGEYVILQSNYNYSNQLMFRWSPTGLTPNAPTGLDATVSSSTQINIIWTDNSTNETGFKLERSTDQSNWTLLATTAANVTSFNNIGLPASTTYYYRARATNGSGDSTNSNTDSATTLASTPVGPAGYTYVVIENQSYDFGTQIVDVAYGANGTFNYLSGKTGIVTFDNTTFGDPLPGSTKYGFYKLAAATGTGLKATYFNNITFTGSAALTRTDATVDFPWSGSPGAGIVADGFSVRWEGQVEAPVTGSYVFSTVSDDGVRLWVNGTQVINNWTNHGPTVDNGTAITLNAGTKYTILMEFFESGGGAEARLRWSYPGQATVIVPQSRLLATPFLDNNAIYELEPQNAVGKRLDIGGASTITGALAKIYADNNGTNQRWQLQEQSYGIYELAPQHATTMRLAVRAPANASGNLIEQATDANTTAQRWQLQDQGNGNYELIPQSSTSRRLNVIGSGTADGVGTEIRTDNNASSMRWKLFKQ